MRRRKGLPAKTLGVLGAVVSAAAIAASMAAGEDETVGEAELRQQLCGGPGVCRVVNTLADPKVSDNGPETDLAGPTLEELLIAKGRPASACPLATAVYGALGADVDAYLGPCPPLSDLPEILP